MIDVCFEMVEFDVPSTWQSNLPQKGIFQCYYTRCRDTVRAVRARGSVIEGRVSPFFWNEATKSDFGDAAFSHFMPSWLKVHACKSGDGEILHEPAGCEWALEDRLRRIQTTMYEKFGSVDEAMQRVDHDGSGVCCERACPLCHFF